MGNNRLKTILITGGSSGIGLATARRFFEEGYQVLITGRSLSKLKDVEQKYPYFRVFRSDVSSIEDLNDLPSIVKNHTSTLDTLFVNAGIGLFKKFEEISFDDFDKLISINYKGVFFSIQKLLPLMDKGSNIIINTSWTHFRGLPTSSLYASSKAAISYLVKVLAIELASYHIRVNAISPGYTSTNQFNETLVGQQRYEKMIHHVPASRFAQPEEIANAVFFLASDKASYINGQEIVVDGGLTAVHVD